MYARQQRRNISVSGVCQTYCLAANQKMEGVEMGKTIRSEQRPERSMDDNLQERLLKAINELKELAGQLPQEARLRIYVGQGSFVPSVWTPKPTLTKEFTALGFKED